MIALVVNNGPLRSRARLTPMPTPAECVRAYWMAVEIMTLSCIEWHGAVWREAYRA